MSKGLGDIQQTVLWTCWVARDHDPFRRPVYLTLREIFLEAGNKDPTDLQLKSARRAVDLMAKDGTILKNYNKPKIRDDLPKGTLLVAAPRNASSRATTLKTNQVLQGRRHSYARTVESVFKECAGSVTVVQGTSEEPGTHEGQCPGHSGEIRTLNDETGLCDVCHERNVNDGFRSMDSWAKWQTGIPVDRYSDVRHGKDDWSPPTRKPETHREAAGYLISEHRPEPEYLVSGSFLGKRRRKPPDKPDSATTEQPPPQE